ncbi:MAG TPA: hypothetical protein VJU16_02335 [Planctomycetota bacterium]|nr:hypothetical protein [Planctomycetota bacterium]
MKLWTATVCALLLITLVLGARRVGRELASTFEGIKHFATAAPSQTVADPDVDSIEWDIELREPTQEPVLSESEVPSASVEELEAVKRELDDLVASQLTRTHGYVPGFERFILEHERQKRDKDRGAEFSWEKWRDQSIAALPEDLREDSDHRRAIEATYHAAVLGEIEDLISRLNLTPSEVGPGFVTREMARQQVYDLRATPSRETLFRAEP